MAIRRSSSSRALSAAIALVAAIVVIVAFIVDVRELAATFLVAYVSVVSVVLGTLALALIAHLTTATWFRPFQARADLVIASLPALAVIGIVLLVALPVLYPWVATTSPNHGYLNVPFFVVRWVVYWTAWITVAEMLRRAHSRHEQVDAARETRRVRRLASIGLIVLAFTMTFASFDWMMSLAPEWQSSIYGLYWFAGGLLAGLALLALLTPVGVDLGWPAPGVDDVHAVGKLLTTFVLFWLYIGFSQYIVIWSGDLPKEVTWYVARARGGWGVVAALLVFGNFVFPFLLLLVRAVKRTGALLAGIGALLLGLHVVDTMWIVMPGVVPVRWWTVLVLIAVLALVCLVVLGALISMRRVTRAQTLPPMRVVRPPA